MNILCLYSDWRWTGPAEPVVQLCLGLQARGHGVVLACRATPAAGSHTEENVADKALAAGLQVSTEFALDRYLGFRQTLRDLVALPRFLRQSRIDVLHCHLSHDQALGSMCARLCGRRRPLLVKTLHRRTVPPRSLAHRFALTGPLRSDGVFVFTPAFRAQYIERFGLDPERIALQPLTIDLERFAPDRVVRPMRSVFGIAEDAVVIGIVTRFQKYRRMDTFIAAAAQVLAQRPQVRFLLLGWSGQIEQTVLAPLRERGLEKQFIVAGYRTEDYDDTLACLDIFTLIMPGYDGTARAVREALAMGKACVVSDVGMLPEIVQHGRTGLVSALTTEGLAQSWLRLIDEPETRRDLALAGLRYARTEFRLSRMAEAVEGAYLHWLSLKGMVPDSRRAPDASSPSGRP
jgi:glycosyltransferase involved in cell wall biosynthesis